MRPDHARVDHAGGVVAPAQAGLDDAGLDARLGQHQERRRRQRLELRRPLPVLPLDGARRLLHPIDGDGERGAADRPSVDLHALVPVDNVRREVGARAQPGGCQRGRGEAHGRGLAVRADDVDRVEPLLRALELVEQRLDALEPELHPERGERLQICVAVTRRGRRGARAARPPPARSAPACRAPPATRCAGARSTKRASASLRPARSISASAFASSCSKRGRTSSAPPGASTVTAALSIGSTSTARHSPRCFRRSRCGSPERLDERGDPCLRPPLQGERRAQRQLRDGAQLPQLHDEVEGLLAPPPPARGRVAPWPGSGQEARARTPSSPSSPQMRSVTCGSTGWARRSVERST